MNNLIELIEAADENRVKNFKEILDKIEDLDDKKKQLWIEIYANAIADRQNAYMMFKNLVDVCKQNSTELAVHGRTIAAFVERMSKSTDQLIKLAEVVRKAEEVADEINGDDIFNRINRGT